MTTQAHHQLETALALEKAFDFLAAKKRYQEIVAQCDDDAVAATANKRLEDMDDLIAEKEVYQRIDENGKRVLTDIGVNIAENQTLIDILMEADAVDFDNETASFIPLRRDYIDACLEKVPRKLAFNPGRNTFGTGATPPFLMRPGRDDLAPANRQEFEKIVGTVAEQQDVIRIFSLPVASDKSISDFEVAQLMDSFFDGLKMTATKNMSDDEVAFFKDKSTWLDGTSLITSLAPMNTMVSPFLRSASTGNNLLLLDLTIAGSSGPQSPEALLTQIHAQVMLMMVFAQTVNPGVSCVHGGIPGVVEAGGDLSYSSPSQPLINAAMARVNQWITGFPSAQSGGSTSLTELNDQALMESELSRNTLRKYGVHFLRHSIGALGSLNYFSLEKLVADCERERKAEALFRKTEHEKGVIPLYFPTDPEALEGIREIADKGNPKNADHTLINVDAFMKWEARIYGAARKKLYYPELNDTVIEQIQKGEMIP